jgi:archaellum component FlaC
MAEEKGLELKTIVRRFADSTEALDGLNERMKSLSATSELLANTKASYADMTEQMRRFVHESSQVTSILRGASEKVQSVMEKAVHLLDGGDLGDLKSAVREVKTLMDLQLNQALSETRELKNMLETQINSTKAELEQARSEITRLKAELAAAESKIANLPSKVTKKYLQ